MKKICNFIVALLLIISCSMICISHIANKFFQEDIGEVVMGELNLENQINTLFEQADLYVTNENKSEFNNLKEDLINNQEVKQIIGSSTQNMLNDIVSDNTEYQNMQNVLKEMVHSYDKDIQKIVGEDVSKEEITSYIDEVITTLPVQVVYNDTVDTFKEEIPQPYIKVLNVVNTISKENVRMISIVVSIVLVTILIVLNRKKQKWLFSVGMGTLASGAILLVLGQAIPIVYQNMLSRLDRIVTNLSNIDFQIITYYGIGFTIIGILCLVLYKLHMRNISA